MNLLELGLMILSGGLVFYIFVSLFISASSGNNDKERHQQKREEFYFYQLEDEETSDCHDLRGAI